MPGPQKKYTEYFNKMPATAQQVLNMQLLAAATGKTPAALQREAWDFYCASEDVAVILRQAHSERKQGEN
jgi:hypothetical protein